MGYRGKLEEQDQARQLRAQSWTLQEIAAKLGVSKSSVSLWVRDVEFTPRPRRNRNYGARGPRPHAQRTRKLAEIARLNQEGLERVGTLSEREFLLTGIALYAGEGGKTDGAVRFANTDPALTSIFCGWLRHFFEIDESRLRCVLYLHQGLNLEEAINFWSDLTRIPPTQFGKPYRAAANATIRTSKLLYGCATVHYGCSRTHRSIMGMVRALPMAQFESMPLHEDRGIVWKLRF